MDTKAKTCHTFNKLVQKKLVQINEAGLWTKMRNEIADNPETKSIIGIFTDMYQTVNPADSEPCTEEEKRGTKTMLRIIHNYGLQARKILPKPVEETTAHNGNVMDLAKKTSNKRQKDERIIRGETYDPRAEAIEHELEEHDVWNADGIQFNSRF